MNGLIKLKDIPNEYVELKEEELYYLIDNALKISGNFNKLSEKLNMHVGKLLKFHSDKNRRKNIKISDLIKLSNFLTEKDFPQYSLENLEKNILYLGRNRTVYLPKFPIDFRNCEGASFIGDLLTDGYLGSSLHTGYANSYFNQLINNLKNLHKVITKKELKKKSFINFKIYKLKTSAHMIKYPKSIGYIINKLDIPKGRRVYTNPSIPEFLFNINKKAFFKFFERALVNEARILSTRIIISHSINVNKMANKPPNLIKDYKKLLLKFGCKTGNPYISKIYKTKKGKTRFSWGLFITGRDLDIIKENCNFDMPYKQKELDKRDNFTTRYNRKDRFDQIIKVCKELRTFKTKDLMEKLNLSQNCITYYLKQGIDKNILIKKGKAQNTKYLLSQSFL